MSYGQLRFAPETDLPGVREAATRPVAFTSTSREKDPPRVSQIWIVSHASTNPVDENVTSVRVAPPTFTILEPAKAGTYCTTVAAPARVSFTIQPLFQLVPPLQFTPSLEIGRAHV